MRLLVAGSRTWEDEKLIYDQLAFWKEDIDVVIEGGARGADKMAAKCAKELLIPLLEFPANWDKYKKAAGPIRNQQMIDEGRPTEVWAFSDDIANSKGTLDMVSRAYKKRITVYVISHRKNPNKQAHYIKKLYHGPEYLPK